MVGLDAAQLGVVFEEGAVQLLEAATQQHVGIELENVFPGEGRVRLRKGFRDGILAARKANLVRKQRILAVAIDGVLPGNGQHFRRGCRRGSRCQQCFQLGPERIGDAVALRLPAQQAPQLLYAGKHVLNPAKTLVIHRHAQLLQALGVIDGRHAFYRENDVGPQQHQLLHVDGVVIHDGFLLDHGGVIVLGHAGHDGGGVGHGVQHFGHAGGQGQHPARLGGQRQSATQVVGNGHGGGLVRGRLATQQHRHG